MRFMSCRVFMNERYYYISRCHLPRKRVPVSLRRRRYCNGETIEKTFSHILCTQKPFLLSNNTTRAIAVDRRTV